jgi:putative MATE family efflux protein
MPADQRVRDGNAERAARRALGVSIAYALIGGLAVAACTPAILACLPRAAPRASPEALEAARTYLAWVLSGSPVEFLGSAAIAALQAGGDTRTPLAIGLAVNAVHLAFNRILILGTPWSHAFGAAGAGFSDVTTYTLEAAFGLAALARSSGAVSLRSKAGARARTRVSRAAWRLEAEAVRRVAAPALAERLLYHLGYLGFVWMIARLGDDVMAANQALLSVESICFLSADGFGVAAATLVAQKLGAGRSDEARRSAILATRYAMVLLTGVGLVVLAVRRAVFALFSPEPRVAELGVDGAPILALAQPFMAATVVLSEALRGGGFTRAVLGVSAFGGVVVRLSGTFVCAVALGLGLRGVWLGSTLDWAVRSALLVWVAAATVRRATDPATASR